jgi:peptide/nickel transport system ATP-binding protein
MGLSGSGKSTLARIAAGLENPDAGRVLWDGRDIRGPGRKRHREGRMLILLQNAEGALNPLKTVAVLLKEVRRLKGLPRKDDDSALRTALAEVELSPDILALRPPELSGGMNRRVLLARLFLRSPDFIIFDEPTSGLDASVQAAVLHLIRKLRRELGFSSLVISHDRDVLDFLCSRTLLLSGGALIEAPGKPGSGV